MLTGTPLDQTPFGAMLNAIHVVVWILVVLALWWALRGQRRWWVKALRVLPVVLFVAYGPVRSGWEAYKWRERVQASVKLFHERCKSAGEDIRRTVRGVDGIVWIRWRAKTSGKDWYDQFGLNDPYGKDCGEEECIFNLLQITSGLELDPQRKFAEGMRNRYIGFRFIETLDPRDGRMYKYSLKLIRPFDHDPRWLESHVKPELIREPIERFSAKYGLTWADVSTPLDRDHWVAGGSLSVVDLETGEHLADRIGYFMDQGLGSEAGSRSPWLEAVATACPEFPFATGTAVKRKRTTTEARDFAVKVVIPN